MWYKLKRIMMRPNGVEKQVRPSSKLPNEYQEVEYIDSSWTQYIITPYNIEEWHIYKSKFRALSWNLYWKTFWWHYWNSSSNRFFTGICEYYWQARWWYAFWNDMNYTFWTPSLWVDYEAEAKLSNGSQYFILDWTELYTRSLSFSSSTQHTVAVLASTETNNSMSVWGATRLYYWQLYDTSNNLEMNMIPCYRKNDNVIWMYDIVNNVFYTNSWSWTFTKWPDVN
jgi:hypothetical protein